MAHNLKVKTYSNREQPTQPAKNPDFEGQHEGEEVTLVFRQHPVVMRKALLKGLIVLLIALVPLYLWTSTSLVGNNDFYIWSLRLLEVVGLGVLVFWLLAWIKERLALPSQHS